MITYNFQKTNYVNIHYIIIDICRKNIITDVDFNNNTFLLEMSYQMNKVNS